MQLHTARLCLDCDEVHASQQCPICASETFAYITRWVPAPERRRRPRPTTSPEAEVYSRLVNAEPPAPSKGRRLLKQGVIGLTAVGLASWVWRHRKGLAIDSPLGISPPPTNSREDDAMPQRAQRASGTAEATSPRTPHASGTAEATPPRTQRASGTPEATPPRTQRASGTPEATPPRTQRASGTPD